MKELQEIWRPLFGYEGKYEISDLGNVKSLKYRGGKEEKLLTGAIDRNGYRNICVRKDNKSHTLQVSRSVARAFPEICGEWFEDCEVDHINTNRSDNRAINLKVCNHKENCNNPITMSRYHSLRENKEHLKMLSESAKNRWKDQSQVEMVRKDITEKWKDPEYRSHMVEAHKHLRKGVKQFSLNGEYLATFESLRTASKETGVRAGSISNNCRGFTKSAGGYRWTYS